MDKTKYFGLNKMVKYFLEIYGYLSVNDIKHLASIFNITDIDDSSIIHIFKSIDKSKHGIGFLEKEKYLFHISIKQLYEYFVNIKHLLVPYENYLKQCIERMNEMTVTFHRDSTEKDSDLILINENSLTDWVTKNLIISLKKLNKRSRRCFVRQFLTPMDMLYRFGIIKAPSQIINMIYMSNCIKRSGDKCANPNELGNIFMNILSKNKIWLHWRRGYTIQELINSDNSNKSDLSSFIPNVIKIGDISEQTEHEKDFKHVLLWAAYTHGIIPLDDLIDIFKSTKGYDWNIPTKQEIIDFVKNLPYDGSWVHMVIYEDCLCAYVFNKDTKIVNLDETKFINWFTNLRNIQSEWKSFKKLNDISNFLSGFAYSRSISNKWIYVLETIIGSLINKFTDKELEPFERQLDFLKHSDFSLDEMKKSIFSFNDNILKKRISYSDKILIESLLDDIDYELPKWGLRGFSKKERENKQLQNN